MFTWPKPKLASARSGRGQTEHLVIASIGDAVHTLNEVSHAAPSWAPSTGEHSSKPDEVRELLEKHCGGRSSSCSHARSANWACWGAETDKFATEAA
jgi:N6-adenosine-specific RNA methylase IME4